MALYTLPEVKKEIKAELKKNHTVHKIHVSIEEFGEGFTLIVDIWYLDRWMNEIEFQSFDMMEEQPLKKCETRAKTTTASLVKAGYKTEFTGLANC